jgi:F420-dependent oxidoreductase-like protein
VQLGTTIDWRGDARELAHRARDLEAAGVTHLWVGEAYTADAVSTLGFLAAVTDRAQIGSSILPLYSRTPTLLAMTAVGVDRLSDGRFILGIGTSGPQVIEGFHGVEFDLPLARTRDTIEICRKVWRGERLVHHGESVEVPLPEGRGTGLGKPLKIIGRPRRERIPIHVAALGPRNVELVAEHADGWMPLHFLPGAAADVWGPSLQAGAARRDPALPPLEVVAGGTLAIGRDVDDVLERTRPALALYFGGMGARGRNFYNDLLRRYGYEQLADDIQEAYLGGRRDEAAAMLPDELVRGLNLVGDEGFVREQVETFREAGVTVLNVQPAGPDRLRAVETVASWLA